MARPPSPVPERFWSKVDQSGDCWLWTANRDHDGYGQFTMDGRHRKAPRVSFELVKGPIPDGLCVLHSCDNPPCVRPDHLRIGTRLENTRESIARGRFRVGDHPRFTKVKGDLATRLITMVASGIRYADIALALGISVSTVGRAARRSGVGSNPQVSG